MLTVARKYGASAAPRAVQEDVKSRMPAWYHLGATKSRPNANTQAGRCLRVNHGVMDLHQCARAARRLTDMALNHRANPRCECRDCSRDREVCGCTNPDRCARAARKNVENLEPLWRPQKGLNRDDLSLTPRRMEDNARAMLANNRVTFDPSVREEGRPVDTVRVFLPRDMERRTSPPTRAPILDGRWAGEHEVYTDGSCTGSGTTSARAGYGAYFTNGTAPDSSGRVPGPTQTNQAAEIYAIEAAARAVSKHASLHIVTD
ncbi:hypothetical protein C8Q76DRAFT_576198, partial [Earliella scabrosa]